MEVLDTSAVILFIQIGYGEQFEPPLCFMSNLGHNKQGVFMNKCELEKINR